MVFGVFEVVGVDGKDGIYGVVRVVKVVINALQRSQRVDTITPRLFGVAEVVCVDVGVGLLQVFVVAHFEQLHLPRGYIL